MMSEAVRDYLATKSSKVADETVVVGICWKDNVAPRTLTRGSVAPATGQDTHFTGSFRPQYPKAFES